MVSEVSECLVMLLFQHNYVHMQEEVCSLTVTS